jgi:uncharacterized membrane protein HdeD (DUF308 family)
MVVVWLLHVTQFRSPFKVLNTAYKWSGALQMLLGTYLLSWCFIFLKPSKLDELAVYSTTDLLQIQHIAISCNAICCGLSEFWYGTGRLKHQQWHVLWCINMVCVGMVFMVHPQPDFAGASTHTMLGMFIILGAIFFLAEKWHEFPEDLYESWNIVLAGGLYLFAASLLIRYEEAPIVMHHGYHTKCHRGAPVTFACLIVSAQSFLLLLWFGLMPKEMVTTCLRRMEALHEDPYSACFHGKWEPSEVEEERGEMNGESDSLVENQEGGDGIGGGSSGNKYQSSGRYGQVNNVHTLTSEVELV